MRMLAQHIWWCLGDSQNVCFSLVSQRCFDERTWVFWLGAMEICALVLSQRWERRSFLRWENEKMLDCFNQFSKQQLWIWTSSYVRVFWDRWRLWFGVIAARIKTNVFAIGKRENAGFFNQFLTQQLWIWTSCYVRVFCCERWRLWFGVTAAIRKTFTCAMGNEKMLDFLN